ncbi:MAG TPA: DUF4055 domain-containing protein, partial [Chloroflexota bacterium]|nr:DUF4055 domain-containing protein [Chloroflexota bacterium]
SGNLSVRQIATGAFRDNAGNAFQQIPLAVCYAGRTDDQMTAQPPLLDVAWANLEHWQIATDLRYYEKLCAFPQPTVIGELAADPLTGVVPAFQTGPGVLVRVTGDSEFRWTEVQGSSLEQLRRALETAKDEIAELGVSFLAKKTRGVETAEAKRLDSAAENANLATAAQGIEDGYNQALMFHALYLGIPAANSPTIRINRDFEAALMDSGVMSAYVALVNAGFPKRVTLKALQAGGRIAEDEDLDLLELEWEAGLEAAEEQKRLEEQDRLAIAAPRGTAPDTAAVNIEYGENGRPARLVRSA